MRAVMISIGCRDDDRVHDDVLGYFRRLADLVDRTLKLLSRIRIYGEIDLLISANLADIRFIDPRMHFDLSQVGGDGE